jgi:hypothetical protein
LVAKLTDLILTSRTIEGKENNYDNLKDISFAITKDSRDKSVADVLAYVRAEWPKYTPALSGIGKMRYAKSDRSDMLHLLARIACHLEDAFALTNRVGFVTYWQRDRGGKTFDIEHLLREPFSAASLPDPHGFTDAKDYSDARDLIGALTLLPRSRNRSLKDSPYRDKLAAYATENVLVQTLCEAFYQNNPSVAAYVENNPGLGLSSVADFSKAHISKRSAVYESVAKEVWKMP